MNKKKIILAAGVVLVLAVAGFWIFGKKNAQGKVDFVTEKVTRGNISNSITATGTIEPVTEVEVGTQVSGIIDKIYIDYNSVVKQGEVIAEMDKVTLLSDLQSAQATYNGAKAEYDYQKKLYTRNKALHEKQLISETDYEQSVYDYERAKSTYEQTQAALAKAERNLSYATITSPINGIVTSKDVEEGQTVASGFETPTLFTIAADLTKMQVVADVDEADIAGIKDSARVTFTVDAYPDDVFEGKVYQIRLGSVNSSSSSSTSTSSETVIGLPGPITNDGTVLQCVNLGWGTFNVEEKLSEMFRGIKVKAGNDANVAALGEAWQGGGKDYDDIVMITLGTGVGGGVIINGKILTGYNGGAGEIGHMHVDDNETDSCNCGRKGCLEQFTSATGVVRLAKRLMNNTDKETKMREFGENITAKDVFDLAKEGDAGANEVVETMGTYLGTAM